MNEKPQELKNYQVSTSCSLFRFILFLNDLTDEDNDKRNLERKFFSPGLIRRLLILQFWFAEIIWNSCVSQEWSSLYFLFPNSDSSISTLNPGPPIFIYWWHVTVTLLTSHDTLSSVIITDHFLVFSDQSNWCLLLLVNIWKNAQGLKIKY